MIGALTGAVVGTKLGYDIRWHEVLVSTPERLESLTRTSCGADAKVRTALGEKTVSVNLKKSTVASALGKLSRLGGVKIRTKSKDLRKLPRVALAAKDMPLGAVLDFIPVPRGLELTIEKGALVVTSTGDE